MPNSLRPDAIQRRNGGKHAGNTKRAQKPHCLFSHVPHAFFKQPK